MERLIEVGTRSKRSTRGSQRNRAARWLQLADGGLYSLEDRTLLSTTGSGAITLPLSFEPNEGQAASSVEFVARGAGYQLALSDSGASLSLQQDGTSTFDRVAMSLLGGQPPSATQGVDPLPGKVNYFLGPDPSAWKTDIPTYAKVELDNVYPGVNLVYYGNQGQLEYDFVVAPGADPSRIDMHYDGITGASLDSLGNLVLSTSGGNVVMHRPVLYQEKGGVRTDVAGAFGLSGPNDVFFQVGSYDHSQPLIIDPILDYSTYFGGTGNDQALAVAVDDQGAAYITGSTLSLDLATTAGAAAPSSFISEVFKTQNSAASWSGAGAGLPDASFSTLVVDPTNPNIVYGGTDGNNNLSAQGLFKSIDGGASWTPIDNGLPTGQVVGSLVIDPSHPSTLYAAMGAFLFKTTDGGSTWTNSGTGIASGDSAAGLGALAISPSNPQILYVMASRNYLYKTTNGGANWTRINGINPGTPSEVNQLPFTQRLIVDPTDPNTIYAGVTKGVFFNTPGTVYKSTNGGATLRRPD